MGSTFSIRVVKNCNHPRIAGELKWRSHETLNPGTSHQNDPRRQGRKKWSEPIPSVFGRVGHLLKCAKCGNGDAILLRAAGIEAVGSAPRQAVASGGTGDLRRHARDSDTYLGDESYGSKLDDTSDEGFNPWEAEHSDEDEYSLDEYGQYDPDRDACIDPDDDGLATDEGPDYDEDLDDKDDWS
jgi:hypothetical protein